MSRKIFVSYKYNDADVRPLQSDGYFGLVTTARHYVNELENLLDMNDHIYKGENDDESLEGFKDETIASKLRDKIFDSSTTIVLISKNMKDLSKPESDQWIPWEISYSLKEMTRGERTSHTNGMLAVVIPDKNGSYEYFIKNICQNGCVTWQIGQTFTIIGKNMFNKKAPSKTNCYSYPGEHTIHTGNDHSYIHPIKWDEFKGNVNWYLDIANNLSQRLDDFKIEKLV
ncbi:MAG: hypothetical protein KCHDKBKB_03125 [Elusimicrobia bacterium]|nr:hypothetical protein [Elusimicrobiota bacterium]